MTSPKPTIASLQRELAAARAENARLRDLVSLIENERDEARTHFRLIADRLKQIRADLAPLLDYFAKDWLGPVAGNYRRLKAFVEGGNG